MARVDRRLQERLTRRRLVTRVIIASLILISVGLLFISRTNDARFSPLRNKVEAVGGSVIHVVNTPFRKLGDGMRYVRNMRTVYSDNIRLKQENIELRQYRFKTQTQKAKLKRLEGLMRVSPGLDIPGDLIAVRVITETHGPFAYSVLVNSGQSSQVKVGYPVMHERGLLGHVIRVGNKSSRVLLLQDLNSRISVMSRESDARAVLIGKNDQPPQLDFYDDPSKWKDGSEVVTSGDDGILPQGLPIGRVIHKSGDDIRVSLFPRDRVDWAWVYPFEPVKPPEDDPADLSEDNKAAIDEDSRAGDEDSETDKNEAIDEAQP